MNAEDWLSAYAERLGTPPPAPGEVDALLALAGEAAHASERRAAPVASWLAAKAGVAPEEALALAAEVGVEARRAAAESPGGSAEVPVEARRAAGEPPGATSVGSSPGGELPEPPGREREA